MRLIRVTRFLRAYMSSAPAVEEQEVRVAVGGTNVEATLYLAPGRRAAPAWVVLHGVTVLGRRHLSLIRFARSLAAAGNTVLVPEVPVWTALRMDSAAAAETIAAGARYLAARPEAREEGVGVVGFSVGATHGLIAAADPQVAPLVRSVVGFGGYCDLHRTLRCMCSGEYELDGRAARLDPDPYGRWIIAANHIRDLDDCRSMRDLATALHGLAAEAGRRGVMAYDASFDALKAEMRSALSTAEQRVWDVLAHPAGVVPDADAANELGTRLATAALAADPLLDPAPALARMRARVVLAHGRQDRLIPYTETVRLHRALAPAARPTSTITELFAHSTQSGGIGPVRYGIEAIRFARLLGRALAAG